MWSNNIFTVYKHDLENMLADLGLDDLGAKEMQIHNKKGAQCHHK
jgi:hypothetical protein